MHNSDWSADVCSSDRSGVPDKDTTLGSGETLQLQAVGTYTKTVQPGATNPGPYTRVISDVSWQSDTPAVISVDTTGLAPGGTTAGPSTITAPKDGKTAMHTLPGHVRVQPRIVLTGTNPTPAAPPNATPPAAPR